MGYGNKCMAVYNADRECVDRYTTETDFTSVDDTVCGIRDFKKCNSACEFFVVCTGRDMYRRFFDRGQQNNTWSNWVRRWVYRMCNGSISRFLQEYGVGAGGADSGGVVWNGSADIAQGGEKDRTAICSVPVCCARYCVGGRWLKGSYTVEAALVFPIIMYAILFIFYSAFYINNEVVLREAAYETAIYGTTLDRTQTESMKTMMQKKYVSAVKGKLFAMEMPNCSISVDKKYITVTVSGVMKNVSLAFLPGYNDIQIFAEKRVKLWNPIDELWINKLFEKT